MKTHLNLCVLISILIFSEMVLASSFLEDWNYYQKISQRQNLTPNDRLYILYRLLAKYQKNNELATKLKKEITFWEKRRLPKTLSSALTKSPKSKDDSAAISITRIFATDTPDFSQVAVFAPDIQKYNYFLLTDPDPTAPPKIVVDLYNASLTIPEKERTLTPESGEISEVRIGQFENFPNKTVRMVVTLFNKKPYQVIRDKQYLLLLVYKNPATPIPSGKEIVANLNLEALSKTESTNSEEIVQTSSPVKTSLPPEEQKISLTGEINVPGDYAWKKDLKLVDLISLAGGFTEEADISRINLLRKQNNQTQSLTINLKKILNGSEPDVLLLAGDVIHIPKKGLAVANEFISRIFPWLALVAIILVIRSGLH